MSRSPVAFPLAFVRWPAAGEVFVKVEELGLTVRLEISGYSSCLRDDLTNHRGTLNATILFCLYVPGLRTPISLSSLLVMKPRKIAWIGTARLPFAKSARLASRRMLTLLHTLLDDTPTETSARGLQRTVSSTAMREAYVRVAMSTL